MKSTRQRWVACLLGLGLPALTLSLLTNANANINHALMAGRRCYGSMPAAFATRACRSNICNSQPRLCRALASTAAILEEPPVVNATAPYTNVAAIEPPKGQAGSTAVILNMNARSVTPALASVARDVFGEENVFVTRTAEEAKLAARTVVRGCALVTNGGDTEEMEGDVKRLQKYSLVVPVGGDGTLSGWIDTMVDEILLYHKLEHDVEENDSTNATESATESESQDKGSITTVEEATESGSQDKGSITTVEEAVKQLPLLGYLPFGTGNGLGYVIGCKLTGEKDTNENASDRRSLLSRINVFTVLKRRKLERARGAMKRLKEVGDAAARYAEERTDHLPGIDAASGICSIVEMPLMEVTHPSTDAVPDADNGKGDLCFFAGAGFDSLMLHDFQQIKAWSKTTKRAPVFIKNALSSVAGYCVALIAKTLPQTVWYGTHRIHVDVTTRDADTLWVDHRRGDFSELAVRPGSQNGLNANGGSAAKRHLIYSGSTGIIAAATTPYYGGGLRLFPYARLIPGRLQLRLGRISPLTGFVNIPKIFEGSYRETGERSFGCLDFIGREFEVEVRSGRYEEFVKRQKEKAEGRKRRRWLPWPRREDESANGQERESEGQRPATKGFPFQHSGESMGVKERFCLRVVEEPVRFVSFLQPRVIIDD